MAQQPPQPGGTSRRAVVVGDDEDAFADPGAPCGRCEVVRAGQRMTAPTLDGQVRQRVDPEKRRPRNVLLQICLTPDLDPIERVAAVDELVADQ
jgi:hypothetical protein